VGASGREILGAYVAGFEVTAKLVYALRASGQDGWHAPGTLGSLGAAAACARLLKLDGGRIEMALGIAASMAGGVVCNFGTMTKPLHVGLGARNGVLAAKLARSGFTENPAAIEARNGLFDVFYHATSSGNGPLDELGKSFALATDGVRIKPYPCGGLTHQAIDAVLDFRANHGITADMIESIDVNVTPHTHNRIAFRIPETGIQGKFCMGLDAFTDSAVKDPSVLKLAEKVRMRPDDNLKAENEGGRPCRVTIHLKNGRTHTREAQHARGSPEVPMSDEELKAKFMECARRSIGESSARRIADCVERLETLEDMRTLGELLTGET
jgi:2-methylcitrate dehydratase PrpD